MNNMFYFISHTLKSDKAIIFSFSKSALIIIDLKTKKQHENKCLYKIGNINNYFIDK